MAGQDDGPVPSGQCEHPNRRAVRLVRPAALLLIAAGIALWAAPVQAQDESGDESEVAAATQADAGGDEQLSLGAEVYNQLCQTCHQPGGVGLPGVFPPLVDNPNVSDAAYVAEVITNGLQGEIVVAGETYNGVMPAFSTLADDDVEALVVYIQSGFQAPAAAAVSEVGPTAGPVAGTELPALANLIWLAAVLVVGLVVLMVVGHRLATTNDRLATPWLDAWLKTGAIVVSAAVVLAFIPNWVLRTSVVADLPRPAQDFIGVSTWGLGLTLLLAGLWYAHRESKI